MTAALVTAGIALVALVLVDLAWTTIAAGSGAGPVTGRLAGALWTVALAAHRHRPSDARLSAAGVAIVFAVLASWIGLAFTGWALVFTSGDGSVRDPQSGSPADLVGKLYFTGYTIFTLGNGDLAPGAGTWQIATILAAGTGLVLVTLSITYLVPVAAAVALRRQMASYVTSLGATPHEIVVRGWDGARFDGLGQHLIALTSLLHTARQQHLTYPVLHYFHSRERDSAAAPSVVVLSQALHLLRAGVAPRARPDDAVTRPLEGAIDAFLATLRGAYVRPAAPLAPSELAPLRAAGVPVVDDETYRRATSGTEERRRMLAGLLADDGWSPRSVRD